MLVIVDESGDAGMKLDKGSSEFFVVTAVLFQDVTEAQRCDDSFADLLRASECASLTPRHFDLNSDPPTVRIDAADGKSRRGDMLPIPSDLVTMLRPWLATIGSDEPLWPGDWAEKRRGSKMMMADLARAGIAYRDEDRQQADFHALRHTFLSRLGRSGASAKAMQRLARHTTVQLTLGRYTHANLFDLKSAVDLLPPISATSSHESEPVTQQATGTDDLGESVLPFVLPPGLPERDAKPFSLVRFHAPSADQTNDGAATTNNIAMTSGPNPESREFAEESAISATKANPSGGDSQRESIACDLFGSVRGSGDRPGLQILCGD